MVETLLSDDLAFQLSWIKRLLMLLAQSCGILKINHFGQMEKQFRISEFSRFIFLVNFWQFAGIEICNVFLIVSHIKQKRILINTFSFKPNIKTYYTAFSVHVRSAFG